MVIMILRFLSHVSLCVRFSSVVLWETYITNRNGRKLKDTRSVHKKTLIVMRIDESFFISKSIVVYSAVAISSSTSWSSKLASKNSLVSDKLRFNFVFLQI